MASLHGEWGMEILLDCELVSLKGKATEIEVEFEWENEMEGLMMKETELRKEFWYYSV